MDADAPSYGEQVVRVAFNPSAIDTVSKMKLDTARLIDAITASGKDDRATAIAITHFQTACMYAVYSLTADA